MRYTVNRLFGALIVSAAAITASSAIGAEREISGDYAMKGKSLSGGGPGYAGTCTLKRNEKVYQVNCVNTGSGDKYVGKGIVRDDMFSLYLGEYLVVYRIEADGTLNGNWAHARSDDYGEEILTPKAPKKK